MRIATLALVAAATLAALPAEAARVEIILDVSGSMRARMGAETKIDSARKAIRATLAGIPPESVVGLRLYGHRVAQENKAESCRDTELSVPFQALDKAGFLAVVDRAQPRGQTPLTYSLEQAAHDFGPASDEERVIILVSDGAETCGGDPAAAARNLLAQGFKLKVHTVGFDVDAAARAQLEAISTATGGEYHDARNADALAQSLTRLTQQSLVVAKSDEGLGQPVRGGDGYESAVALQPGQLYRLDHHQRHDEYDYFYVELKGRQNVEASIETTQKTVTIEGSSFREDGPGPYAGLTLQDGSRNKLGTADAIGRGERKTLQGIVGGDAGRLYILIGTSYGDQHKDSRFSVKLTPVALAGDAGSASDAGGTEREAIEVAPGSYRGSIDAADDAVDYFKFKADEDATYVVRVRPGNTGVYLQVSVADTNGQVSKEASAGDAGGQAAITGLRFPKGGDAFIRVGYWPPGPKSATDYSLDVRQEGGGAPAKAGEPASFRERVRALFQTALHLLLWGAIFAGVFLAGGITGYIVGRRRRR
jgi:hypothetical protein